MTWGATCEITPHTAAHEGDIILLESLIFTEFDANKKESDGTTALHHAAFGGSLDCLCFLLENGATVDERDNNGVTALHIASYQGHLSCVEALISYNAQVNIFDNSGQTPLHKAALYNHSDCLDHLLKSNASVDARTKENVTSLHITAKYGYADCLFKLLSAGAEVNLVDAEKRTALHIAALHGHEQCIDYLLQFKADPRLLDSTGATALHNATFNNYSKIAEIICNLDSFAEFANIGDQDGITALHHVAYNGNNECLTSLLRDGINIQVEDNKKYTPLHLASIQGHHEVVSGLLQAYAKKFSKSKLSEAISVKAETGVTALHLGCLEGHLEVVKLLIESGCSINEKDGEEATALHKAAFHGHEKIVQLLIDQKGCDVTATDKDGDTALHKAAYSGHDECIDILLHFPELLDAKDSHSAIPAHNAAMAGQISCLDKLINDKNVNTEDNNGNTPLHTAVIKRQTETVQYLITKPNVNINALNHKGHTPLYIAIENGFEAIVHELIMEGAELNQSCKDLLADPNAMNNQDNAERITQLTIDRFIEERDNRAKMKDRMDPKTRAVIRQLVTIFNNKPVKGLQALIEKGVVGKSPQDIAEFLHNNEQLNKRAIGELLGEEQFTELRKSFTDYLNFAGLGFEPALRLYLSTFRLPGEAQKIDRLMECFADRFYSFQNENEKIFNSKDACYILAFSTVMLNTDAHNPAIKKQDKMTKQQFVNNNRGINDGGDIDRAYLERVYDGIVAEGIKMDTETNVFTNADKKGYLTKQGGRVKTWKKRWFVLTNNNLYYFRGKEQEKNPLGWIPLEDLQITMDIGKRQNPKYIMVIQASVQGNMIKSCKLVDGIPVPGAHSRFVIGASSEEELKDWYDTINACMQKNPYLNVIQDKLKARGGPTSKNNQRRKETNLLSPAKAVESDLSPRPN